MDNTKYNLIKHNPLKTQYYLDQAHARPAQA
jgi:hypothetical protein